MWDKTEEEAAWASKIEWWVRGEERSQHVVWDAKPGCGAGRLHAKADGEPEHVLHRHDHEAIEGSQQPPSPTPEGKRDLEPQK